MQDLFKEYHSSVKAINNPFPRILTQFFLPCTLMQDEIGETALHAASRHSHLNVMTVLIQRGADVNSLTKVGGVHSSIVEDVMLSLEVHVDEAYTACG